MRTRVSASGLRELDANLAKLSKATARNVLRRVLIKAGQPIAESAARPATDDPATNPLDLRTLIAVGTQLRNEVGNAEFAAAIRLGQRGDATVTAMRDARRAAAGEGSFAYVYVGPSKGAGHSCRNIARLITCRSLSCAPSGTRSRARHLRSSRPSPLVRSTKQ